MVSSGVISVRTAKAPAQKPARKVVLDNVAYLIALQVVPAMAWGGAGEAKTALAELLALAMGYQFYPFIPSLHMPEDVGGFPVPPGVGEAFAKTVPLEMIYALTQPKWFFFIDETTTAPQQMRPPLLSVMNEKRVGKLNFHPTTIICGAANPPELAPNSSPLEPSMCNRMYHHEWELPFDAWYEGMQNGGQFKLSPDDVKHLIVGDIGNKLPVWTRWISNLCKSQTKLRRITRLPETEMAYPSLRSWFNLAKCLAAADTVSAEPAIYSQLATGCVGSAAAAELMQYVAAMDLYDVDAVLDGTEKVSYDADRVDTLAHLPDAMLSSLRTNQTGKRVDTAVEVMIELGENQMLDCVMGPLSEVLEVCPDYTIPAKLLTRYGKLLAQIGGAE